MEAPKLPSFIKQNRHKAFEFKPRYYDERQERLDKLKRKYEREKQIKKTNGEHMRENLSNSWQDARQTKVNSSNRMLMVIILALLSITYYIIKF
ncbi:MAG: hypothetical protein DA405_09075 [Bacteroidetes bacterium]|nr:MAG: hypothetical protein DA405_09075 [Bacteroidota bacterium]